MWKQQIALRSVLGDPWPSGSIQRGAIRADSDIDDREALVASMNEINRMGRDTNRTAQQHRDVTEQAIRSASVSAEMLSRIISGSDAERERRRREGKVRARPSVHASPPQPCPGGTGYTHVVARVRVEDDFVPAWQSSTSSSPKTTPQHTPKSSPATTPSATATAGTWWPGASDSKKDSKKESKKEEPPQPACAAGAAAGRPAAHNPAHAKPPRSPSQQPPPAPRPPPAGAGGPAGDSKRPTSVEMSYMPGSSGESPSVRAAEGQYMMNLTATERKLIERCCCSCIRPCVWA